MGPTLEPTWLRDLLGGGPSDTPAAWLALAGTVGVVLGAALMALIGRAVRARTAAQLEAQAASVTRLEGEVRSRGDELGALHEQLARARAETARLEERLAGQHTAALERTALLDSAETRLREAFQALSAEALASSNRRFLDLAHEQLDAARAGARTDLDTRQQRIDALLGEMRDALGRVDAKIVEFDRTRHGADRALSEQLRLLAESQTGLRGETANLVRALRTPQVRGRWGEMQLRRVVELAGMTEHCDFDEQHSLAVSEGERRLRPDLVVRLPGERSVVVDAKAPLAAYLEAVEAGDDQTRTAKLRDHARQVRSHVVQLGARGYAQHLTPGPDFVVLFLPGENFLGAALEHDPELIEFGLRHRVIPASPTTLIALLRSIAHGWQQERVADGARRIAELGRELHVRLTVFSGHFGEMRRGLERAVEAHNRAVGSLESRVLPTARQLRDLVPTALDPLPILDLVETPARRSSSDLPGELSTAISTEEPPMAREAETVSRKEVVAE